MTALLSWDVQNFVMIKWLNIKYRGLNFNQLSSLEFGHLNEMMPPVSILTGFISLRLYARSGLPGENLATWGLVVWVLNAKRRAFGGNMQIGTARHNHCSTTSV